MSPAQTHAVTFGVLGPLRVVVDGVEVQIATRRQRALLVLLLVNAGRAVPAERLVDQLWDGTPPPQAAVTLRSYVSTLRQALGGRDGLGGALTTHAQGYRLDVPPESIDAVRLGVLATRGRELLRSGDAAAALSTFEEAVALWSGDPLAEVAGHEAVQSTLTQLTETYLGAAEGRFEALLATGRHVDALPGLEAFASEHPLREEPRALLVLALYRSGRAAEALEEHRRFRALLADELGIDPSARFERLQQQVLEQDPELAPPLPPAPDLPEAPGGRRLVGRHHELVALDRHLNRLTTGRGGALVLVAGEPGIGKSTLLEALASRAREQGVAVHAGRSPAAAGAPAFWPWRQVVDSVAATLTDEELSRAVRGAARPVAQLSADVAERTGQPLPMTGDDLRVLRFSLYEAVSVFLRQAGGDRPAVVLLDDLHWADVPSLELLSYVTPALGTRPLLVVAAYRDLPADRTEALTDTLATVSRDESVDELVLAGLAPDDVAALTHDLIGTDQADARTRERFAALVHERTGGNPFFVRQLARLMVESGTGPQTSPVPPGVRHVIASRLRGLSTGTTSLLEAAAVVGRDFDLQVAAAAGGLPVDEALDAYDDATRHGLLDRGGGTDGSRRFVHALVQEVVLEQLPAGRAARLHAAVAGLLRQRHGTAPEQLAEHLWAARDVVGVEAVDAQVAAAAASASVFAHERAEAYLRRALDLARSSGADADTELVALLQLFRLITAVRGWGHEEVRVVVDRTLELTGSSALTDTTARLWWSLFFYLLDRDDASYVEVVETLAARLDVAGAPCAGGPDHAAVATVHLCRVLADLHRDDRPAAQRDLELARVHVEAAAGETLAAYDEHLHVMLLVTEAYWAALHGDAEANRAAVDAAVAIADADGRPFPRAVARTLGAASTPYLGDPAAGSALAHAGLELSERFGFGWLATLAGCLCAWADAHAGGTPDAAVDQIQEVLDQLTVAGRRGNLSSLHLLLADLHRLQGRPDQARRELLAARSEPGPYRGLVVDAVDARLAALG